MRVALGVVPAVIILGAAQGALAQKLTIGEVRPDLLVVGTVAIGLLLGPTAGALAGLLAGLVHASVAGMGLGSFLVSRTLLGYLAGAAKPRVFYDNPIVPFVGGAAGTLVAEAIFTLVNPPARLAAWLAPLPLIALYNGLLAFPVTWVLRRMLVTRERPRRLLVDSR